MQQFLKGWNQRQRAVAGLGFGTVLFNDRTFPVERHLGHGMTDGDGLFLKVNSVPFQTHDFAPTQPVESRQYDAQFNRIAAHDLE